MAQTTPKIDNAYCPIHVDQEVEIVRLKDSIGIRIDCNKEGEEHHPAKVLYKNP